MNIDAIIINEKDTVATAFRDIMAQEKVIIGIGERVIEFLVQELILYGHKFAVRDIQRGENIIKYGEIIGRATSDIPSGRHVHVQNVESLRGRGDLEGVKRGIQGI